MIFIGIGTAHIGMTRKDAAGNVISQTPAKWEADPAGGCVAMGLLNPETMTQEGNADIFGDWDAAAYLGRVLELIHPNRQINVPDLPDIIKKATEDGVDICEYCQRCACGDCIVETWKRGKNNG